MRMVLVIYFLSVRSSYLRDEENEVTEEIFDTVQFMGTEQSTWRIRTYADDQDVHAWSIHVPLDDLVELARKNTEKHYGDVLSEGYILDSSDGIEGVRRGLRERGLPDHLEISADGFVFWTPEGSDYRSRSTPRRFD